MAKIINIKRILSKFELDKSVLYSLFSKIWMIFSGSFTMSLIVYHFTKSQQGFYYTFASLLALQTFVEMGLGFVIQQFSSHEWPKLTYTKGIGVKGENDSISRLSSIANISMIWYLLAGIFAFSILIIVGSIFFYNSTHTFTGWFMPWLFLSFFSSLNLILTPIWSILEGCNQVQKLYGFRLLQGMLSNFFVWISIFLGLNLWSLVISSCTSFIAAIFFIYFEYRFFIIDLFFKKYIGPRINWKKDMLSMQWRVAISWLSGYFSFNLFTPLLFKFQGSEVAGQFGMSWSIVSIICNLGLAWFSPKVPPLAMLVSENKFIELDIKFFKILKLMSLITITISICFLSVIIFSNYININILNKIINRLLPIPTLIILITAQFINILSVPFSTYMRMHKKEPVMFLSVTQAILISISVYVTCKFFNINAMSLAFLLVNSIILIFIVRLWYSFKKEVQTNI